MDKNELNAFILRYATQYKTKMALMLNGKWGSGKSYYINHTLCPFLAENKVKCIVVSLFGIESVSELSKQIYMRLRLPTFVKNNEAAQYATIIGHSIMFNALSYIGISANIDDNQLQDLYKSVNLNNVLIIFEDVERSSIDIIKLLGFVNGLVEYDGAKVMLVGNEDEMLKGDDIVDKDANDSESLDVDKHRLMTEKNIKEYRKMKEKTIGDTIVFTPNFNETICNILKGYSGVWIDELTSEEEIYSIRKIIDKYCNNNMRIFIYAIQKYNDIFSEACKTTKFNNLFLRVSFEGILLTARKFLTLDVPAWDGKQHLSSSLGTTYSPVFRFIYDYLKTGIISKKEINNASREYERYLRFEEHSTRVNQYDLFVIRNFEIKKETEVRKALMNIERALKEFKITNVYAYAKLAYEAMRAGHAIDYDTSEICSTILNNSAVITEKYPTETVFFDDDFGSDIDYVLRERYKEFYGKLREILCHKIGHYFSYNPEDIHEFLIDSKHNKEKYIVDRKFISLLDIDQLVSMLEKCNAEQMLDFRRFLSVFYQNVSRGEYSFSDVQFMSCLESELNSKYYSVKEWDRIQRYQIGSLVDDLDEYISHIDA